jgi:anti-anti-sigma factor
MSDARADAGQFFRVVARPRASVIELSLPEYLDLLDFDRLTEQLLAVLDGQPGHRWVLDLSEVVYMGSAVLGLMVNIRQRIQSTRGVLVLCSMSPRLSQVFRASSLQRLFNVARTRQAALTLIA